MRIEQLEWFAAVTRSGSMRRASDSLHVSQPALSEALAKLESELGLSLLERRRDGARLTEDGRRLLPHVTEVLDAIAHLRAAADSRRRTALVVRVGTVNAATVPVVAPAIRTFRASRPDATVELVTAQQNDIRAELLAGGLDLGLVNVLDGDEAPAELSRVELARGRAVVCCSADSPLAALDTVSLAQLAAEPFIAMRTGYLMHRLIERLAPDLPAAFSADGAEMGKLMVAEGLGVTVLPDYSVTADPLERAGLIVTRPLAGPDVADTAVTLVAEFRRSRRMPVVLGELLAELRRQAGSLLVA